ncbi:hypothetical protein [Sporosarcina pasteurii]|uniref:DUF340 domain-containing protein n=1 Tax=Sporosarcina pasteurii TaxID=1474 RepID=A0A380BD21_SPOPA|nr:hypothetical protein [Sporosarcina pasteurii]MDS9472604.1 hypothetical protein [Sporosarcina pasteurii]QBQ06152.1 hypothetical protein E2C16_10935 [Sporosarcina pasteurii]SUI99318.1 Uncharacterised protein [Sporosarcina pasteurii]
MLRNIQEWTMVLAIIGLITLVGNWIGYNVMPTQALPGMILLIVISIAGLALDKLLPFNIPAIAYISLIAIVLSIPGVPGSETVVKWTSEVNLLAITTPILAYAGIAIGRSWADFAKLGWRSLVVGSLVLLGTYLGSAVIAEIILRMQGII